MADLDENAIEHLADRIAAQVRAQLPDMIRLAASVEKNGKWLQLSVNFSPGMRIIRIQAPPELERRKCKEPDY